uniref:Coiled-coil domain containing 90B n=1 Tax=Callorhinchus milii TaxID=7868 RepID=A0A4W3JW46_CALMI
MRRSAIQCCRALLHTNYITANTAPQSPATHSPGTGLKRGFFTTGVSQSYNSRRVEITSPEQRKAFFDTHVLVLELQANGFKKEQAEAIVTVIANLTSANMESMYKDMVTKPQQEIMLQQIMAHLDSIRKDMVILEKSEFSNLRTENEDEVKKMRADTTLDLNLEKSRIVDMFRDQEKQLMATKTEFTELNADTALGVAETNKKIDTDIALLKTMLESLKLETVRYLAASVFTCLAIALGLYRMWQK